MKRTIFYINRLSEVTVNPFDFVSDVWANQLDISKFIEIRLNIQDYLRLGGHPKNPSYSEYRINSPIDGFKVMGITFKFDPEIFHPVVVNGDFEIKVEG
jgi:hypothetical protein